MLHRWNCLFGAKYQSLSLRPLKSLVDMSFVDSSKSCGMSSLCRAILFPTSLMSSSKYVCYVWVGSS